MSKKHYAIEIRYEPVGEKFGPSYNNLIEVELLEHVDQIKFSLAQQTSNSTVNLVELDDEVIAREEEERKVLAEAQLISLLKETLAQPVIDPGGIGEAPKKRRGRPPKAKPEEK